MPFSFALALRRAAATVVALAVLGCTSVTPTPSPIGTGAPSLPPTATATGSAGPSATPPSASASPSAPASATPTGSVEAPTPGPTVAPDLASQIDAVTAQVPPIRELQPMRDVPYELVTRDQFQQDLLNSAFEDTTPEQQAAEERALKRLGLLPADADLNSLLAELYGAQVAAYYRPETGRFYIIQRDSPFGPADKVAVAHEYTHALQDQHFDLEGTRIKDNSAGDAILAQLAVIEGDAVLTSQDWLIANLSLAEQVQLVNDAFAEIDQGQLQGMPLILRRQLEFPYTEGFLFTRDVYAAGGFDAVDQVIQTPPASTEQILHAQKFFDQEAPVAVDVADLLGTLGNGWYQSYEQTMGELNIQVLAGGGEAPAVNIPGFPTDWPHQEIAAGWGGDRLRMYENTDGHWVIEWHTAWDSAQDQTEFEARMTELAGTFAGVSHVADGWVLIASDQATLNLAGGAI